MTNPLSAAPKPTVRPTYTTGYSCGPTAKFPGWSLDMLKGALVGRSHRAMPARKKIRQVFEQRFTARRMALDYLAAYRSLIDAKTPRLRLVVDDEIESPAFSAR